MKGLKTFLVMLLAFSSIMFAQATIIYVDQTATGLNDGSDWANAFIYLQDALDAARADAAINVVYIAEGTYYPDESSYNSSIVDGDRDATFELADN